MKSENIITEKSMGFAVRIVNLYKYLSNDEKEYVLSKQILRSGTSIGANIREAEYGQSRNDFVAKMSIALKEASETMYWLELLFKTGYLTGDAYVSMNADCEELVKLLVSIVKTTKS